MNFKMHAAYMAPYVFVLLTPTILSNPYNYAVNEPNGAEICLTADYNVPLKWLGGLEQAILYWNTESDASFKPTKRFVFKGYWPQPLFNCTHVRKVETMPIKTWLAAAGAEVWIKDEAWTTNYAPLPHEYHLPSILIHELGHLLGFEHTDNTIMRAEFEKGKAYYYNVGDPNLGQFLGYTEWKKQLMKAVKLEK